ncbi:acyltransferase domain-containing protein [Streptomyces sp. Vc74B-19]|uniref:beta-ketoacyl synthase N-terminal-like domain-containing protein n=1 Tax=Streptomyces sp. Vc74B-19 TaxID=2741324 RepID=UPI001BFC2A03|nr:beta-ketoacyl synthase N-terminal-like domain-containing protein [Streptomyces sp. Vc74B-19]MBT3166092.1 acyltransferase domain-containing protein [Streptomyces sp. Vc74B-19]
MSATARLVREVLVARLGEWYGVRREDVTDDRPFAEHGLTSRDAVALTALLGRAVGRQLPATLLWETPTPAALVAALTAEEDRPPADAPSARAAMTASPAAGAPVAVVGVGCRFPGGADSPAAYWRLLTDGRDAVGTVPEGRWERFVPAGSVLPADLGRHGGFLAGVEEFDAEFFGIAADEAVALDPQQRMLLEVTREALDHAAIPAPSLAGTRTGVFVGISGTEYAHLTAGRPESVSPWTAAGASLSVAAGRVSYALDLRGPSLAVDTACSSSLVAVDHAVRALADGTCDVALAAGVNVLLSPTVTLGLQRAGALSADGRCKAFDAAADGMVRGEGCGVVVLRRLADAERAGDRVLAVITATEVNSDGRSNGLTAPNAAAQRALLAHAHGPDGRHLDYVEAHGTGTPLGDPVEAGALGAVLGQGRPAEQPLLLGSVKTNIGHLEAAAGIAGLIKTVLALHHDELPGQLHFADPNPHIDLDALRLRVLTAPEPWPRYSGTATAGVSSFGFSGTNAHVVLREHRPGPAADPALSLAADPALSLAADPALTADGPGAPREPGGESGTPAAVIGIAGLRRAVPAPEAGGPTRGPDAGAREPRSPAPGDERPGPGTSGPGSGTGGSGRGTSGPGSGTGGPVDRPGARPPLADRLPPAPRRPALVLLDAPTDGRLRSHAGELARWLDSPEGRGARPADVARTLAGRTGRGRRRAAVVARDRDTLTTALHRLAAGDPDAHLVTADRAPIAADGPGPVWVFSGYGSQWPGMGRELLAAEPAFADAVERLEPVLREHAGVSLLGATEPDADLTSLTTVMPALFGLQVALAELWRSYGVEPSAVIGHSLGEIAAAVTAGALDVPTGARIVASRSRLLTTVRGGTMAVVDLPPRDLGRMTEDLPTLEVAVYASPEQCVVTGSAADVGALVARVTAEGGFARTMPVPVAGHSPDVDPLLDVFAWELGAVPYGEPACRRYSTVLDDPLDDDPYDTAYWLANLRRPVRFEQAVRAAARDGHRVFVEVAPHPTQAHPLARTLEAAGADEALVVPTLRRGTDDAMSFRTALATLLVHGARVPSARETLHPDGRITDVPSPRWQHRRYWAGEDVQPAPEPESRPAAATRLDRLRMLVARVMGFAPDRLDPDVPLTDLGLDSLTAVRIRTAVLGEFGSAPEIGVLLRQGTLRGVAGLLDDAPAAPSPLPPLAHPGEPTHGTPGVLRAFPGTGPRPPLFLAHAAGGSSDVYGHLAARLDGDRPVYGFDRLEHPDDVPARAAEFARRIRQVRPDGPWTLGGWSYGGVVAQETARLLSREGEVTALVLVDSILPLPAPPVATPAQEARRRFVGFAAYVHTVYGAELDLPYAELGTMDDTAQVDLVLALLEKAVDLPAAVLAHQRSSYLDLRSAERHTPGPYPGRTLLYRATRPAPHTVRDARYERTDATLGWDAHCPDLTVTDLPAHHLALLDPPAVDTLAADLTRALDPSGPPPEPAPMEP